MLKRLEGIVMGASRETTELEKAFRLVLSEMDSIDKLLWSYSGSRFQERYPSSAFSTVTDAIQDFEDLWWRFKEAAKEESEEVLEKQDKLRDEEREEYDKKSKLPKNLDECYSYFRTRFSEKDREEFKACSEDDLLDKFGHHDLGQDLRNEFCLWEETPLKRFFMNKGLWHADDISTVIMISYNRHLNNRNVDLKGQVKFYQKYCDNYREPEGAYVLHVGGQR